MAESPRIRREVYTQETHVKSQLFMPVALCPGLPLRSIHIYPFLKLLPSLFKKINNGNKTDLKKLSPSQKSFMFLSFLSLFFRSVFHLLAHFPHPVSLMNRKCKAENTSDSPQIHELAWKPPSGSQLCAFPSRRIRLFFKSMKLHSNEILSRSPT